ncbi:RNA-directed DNA polymerase [Brevibacterium linens]|uniref:RNA-directed DNA polymerase n=1 Tax=Brevibacterium linens TaxID=1703 RepID=UPI003BF4FD3E
MTVKLETEFDVLTAILLGAKDVPLNVGNGQRSLITIDSPIAPNSSSQWHAPLRLSVRRDRFKQRDLDVLSLQSQLAISYLYRNKQDAILYFCNRSTGSLRHVSEKADYGKSLRHRFKDLKKRREYTVETQNRVQTTYNSYFTYESHPFVGSFYDSYKWRTLEGKWRLLRRLDIANCFKSVYTHSVAWATRTELLNKMHLIGKNSRKLGNDLGRTFDKVMQSSNWGETHGLPVGPEASRIFAEIVLQALDKKILTTLESSLSESENFEILRYVDDYFIYANDGAVLDKVSQIVVAELRQQQFEVNASKTADFETPFTTNVSSLKAQLKQFLRLALPVDGGAPSIDGREIGVQLKSVILGQDGNAAAVGSSLSLIDRALRKFLRARVRHIDSRDDAFELFEYVWEFVQSFSYQYLSAPSVSNCMKVVRLIHSAYGLPDHLTRLDDKSRRLLKVQVSDYVQFLVRKLLQRLVRVEGSDAEICYILSLANGCDIDLDLDNSSGELLIDRLTSRARASCSPKSDFAFVYLALSVTKYLLRFKYRGSVLFERCYDILKAICDCVFDEKFIPKGVVQTHAVQELLLMSVVCCDTFTSSERLELLDQSWLRSLLDSRGSNSSGPNSRVVNRFLKRLVAGTYVARADLHPFLWGDLDLEQRLYEKQPQFIY